MLQSLNQNKLFQEIYLLLLGSKKVALTYEYDFRTADRFFSTGETKNIGKYLIEKTYCFSIIKVILAKMIIFNTGPMEIIE